MATTDAVCGNAPLSHATLLEQKKASSHKFDTKYPLGCTSQVFFKWPDVGLKSDTPT